MRFSAVGLVASVVLVGAAVACGGDAGDAERFCAEVTENREAIVTAPATVEEIDDYIGLYRRLGESAPLAVEEEWDALVVNYETASTVEPDDPESVQRVITQAVRTERAAVHVRNWLVDNCAIDLGEPATFAAAATVPTTTSGS